MLYFPERIFVHESVYDKFVEGATALFDKYVYGDPMSPEVTIGPIANEFVLLSKKKKKKKKS